MKRGIHKDDRWYKERFGVPEKSWYSLGNLTRQQSMAVLYFNIGNYYMSLLQYSQAISFYRRVLKELPDFAEAWGNLAIAYDGNGDSEKALRAGKRAQKIDPALENVSKNLGALYVKQKKYAEAIHEYTYSLKLHPNDADIYYGLAFAHAGLNNIHEAKKYAQKAVLLRDDFPAAQKLLRDLN